MKKYIVIHIIVCLLLSIGFIGFVFWNNRVITTITIDINPSVKIGLGKNNEVKTVVALNDDAKDIITSDIKGKTLSDTFEILITNLIDKGYIDEETNLDVILYVDGNLENDEVANQIEFEFGKKNVHSEITVVESITKEDEILAKKYNISPAKAAYIKTITDESSNIEIEDLANKSVSELIETKTTGKYCDKDYILEGDWCLKEVDRIAATSGLVCPRGYYEYNNICYEETGLIETDELICREGFTLKEGKCESTIKVNAEPSKYSCTKGEAKTRLELGQSSEGDGNANEVVCVDYSSATHPVSPCEANDGTEYTIIGGTCYWHRAPIIPEGCPGKINVGGACWDDATGIYICVGYRDGKQYSSRDEYCENSISYTSPIVEEYKCEKDFTVNGDKCIKVEIEDSWHKTECESGYTEVENGKCINENDTVDKIDGFVCNSEFSKVVGNTCIIYEKIEAKQG